MSSPTLSITTLKSSDTEYRGSSYFVKRKKEYIEFLDKFIGKKPGIIPKNSYNDLVKVAKKKTLNQENKDKIKEAMKKIFKEKVKNDRHKELMNKVADKLHMADKLKKEYDIRIILATLNYVTYMSNSYRNKGLWDNTNGKKAEAEFFKSFEKFFTPEELYADNEPEILSNFHETLLAIKEKYKLKLHENEKEHYNFNTTLLLMHRYPVNTSQIDDIYDDVNMSTTTMTLQKYLKKNDNIVIQVRGQYKRDTVNGNIVKTPINIFTRRSLLKGLLKDKDKTFYGCLKRDVDAFRPHDSNLDQTIVYIDNKDVQVTGNKFWDISIIKDFPNHQVFVLQNMEKSFPTYTSLSMLRYGANVVGKWHCQHDAPNGTSKLLLGVADLEDEPRSSSPLLRTPSVSPLSGSSISDGPSPSPIIPSPPEGEQPEGSPLSPVDQNVTVRRGPGRPRTNPQPAANAQPVANAPPLGNVQEGRITKITKISKSTSLPNGGYLNDLIFSGDKIILATSKGIRKMIISDTIRSNFRINNWFIIANHELIGTHDEIGGFNDSLSILKLPDSNAFFSIQNRESTIKLWSYDQGEGQQELKSYRCGEDPSYMKSIDTFDNKNFVSVDHKGKVYIWRDDKSTPVKKGLVSLMYQNPTANVMTLDSETFIISLNANMLLYKKDAISSRDSIRKFDENGKNITSLCKVDDSHFISGDEYGNVKLWNKDSNQPIRNYNRQVASNMGIPIKSIKMLDSQHFAVVRNMNQVLIYNKENEEPLLIESFDLNLGQFKNALVIDKETLLISASDKIVQFKIEREEPAAAAAAAPAAPRRRGRPPSNPQAAPAAAPAAAPRRRGRPPSNPPPAAPAADPAAAPRRRGRHHPRVREMQPANTTRRRGRPPRNPEANTTRRQNQDDDSEVSGRNLVNDILANYQDQDEAQALIMEMGLTQYMNPPNISSRASTPVLPPTPPSGSPTRMSPSTPSESPPSGPPSDSSSSRRIRQRTSSPASAAAPAAAAPAAAAERLNIGAACQEDQECRSGVCTQNVCRGSGNNSRVVGDRCDTNSQCINNNCVNNVCTRRPYTARRSTGDLGLSNLFSSNNSGGRLKKKSKKTRKTRRK